MRSKSLLIRYHCQELLLPCQCASPRTCDPIFFASFFPKRTSNFAKTFAGVLGYSIENGARSKYKALVTSSYFDRAPFSTEEPPCRSVLGSLLV